MPPHRGDHLQILGVTETLMGRAEEIWIQDGSFPVAQFISPALHTGYSTAFS